MTEGPHGAPEFFTRADIDTVVGTDYTVHFNSDRTGVRLDGPKPQWARTDGGEAGLHPSNIHDNAYCVGALDFTGDTPILLGPDGPSLGGFVCPVTVVGGDRWKLGQMAPGDAVRFVPVRADRAPSLRTLDVDRRASFPLVISTSQRRRRRCADAGSRPPTAPAVTLRRAGDGGVLVEYGPMTLDLAMRARVHVLHEHLMARDVAGITELTPGVRSLQVQFDPAALPMAEVVDLLARLDGELPPSDRSRRAQPHGPAAAVVGRPGHARGHPALHARRPRPMRRGARGTSSSSGGSTASTTWRRSTTSCSTRSIWCSASATSIWARRWPLPWIRDTAWSPPSTTRPAPGHRRTRSASAGRTCASTAWRVPAATSSSVARRRCGTTAIRATPGRSNRAPRGCCATSTGSASTRSVPTNCWTCGRTWPPGRGDVDIADGEFSLAAYRDFLATDADGIAAFRQQQSVAFAAERASLGPRGRVQRAS